MNIIITGGSRGIGRATAIALAQNKNNRIIITGRNGSDLKRISENAEHSNISFHIIDFKLLAGKIDSFCSRISEEFGSVDILINNAGAIIPKHFEDLSDTEIRTMMEVNFFAPAVLIRSLLPYFKKGSHIINISSMGGFQGSAKFTGLSCYSASKAALASLTECLATEFAARGIAVNCLAPGSVQTEMLGEAFPGYKAPVTAEEMGEFFAYFAVNGHRFFNGKILPVALSRP